jgi:1-phosphatidylinositol-4-phosphate 5-kinase
VGEWREGQKNGHGKYVYNDGESYEGGWKESMYHGKGLKTYSNGDC